MIRLFDYLVFTATLLAFMFSGYLFFMVDPLTGLFVGLWSVLILGFGIHIKLLRIVHFVLYKNLNIKGERDG